MSGKDKALGLPGGSPGRSSREGETIRPWALALWRELPGGAPEPLSCASRGTIRPRVLGRQVD